MSSLITRPMQWLLSKRQTSRQQYTDSSITIRDGFGYMGSKPRPFNYDAAVARFRSWVYCAALLNAQAVASVPLRLYLKKRSGRKLFKTRPVPLRRKRWLMGDDGLAHRTSRHVINKATGFGDDFEEVIDNHPVLEVLRHINPMMGQFDLTMLRVLHMELTGNAYLHPIHNQQTGVPEELWPLFPQWTWIIPDRDGVDFVKGYLYGSAHESRVEFESDEVIHFKRPNPRDLFYGMGKVEAAWSVLALHEAEREHQTALYDNYARPDYLMIVKSGAGMDELSAFEQKVNDQLRGRRKGGKFLGVTGDVDIKPLNFTNKELGDPDSVVEEIASVFGVPVTKLKANDPNRANAEEGDAGWMKDTINPLCIMDADVLNSRLLPLFGIEDDAVLAYDDPVPQNREFELRYAEAAISNGWRTINAQRMVEGEEPVDGGDDPRINGRSLQSIDREQQPSAMPSLPGFGSPRLTPAPSGELVTSPAGAATEPVKVQPLTGAQLTAATDILGDVRGNDLPPKAAIELLVAVGIARDSATAMVDSMAELPPKPELSEDSEPKSAVAAGVSRASATKMTEAHDPDPEPTKQATITVKQSELWLHNDRCGCTKAAETGDSDDTQRDDESEAVIRAFAEDIQAVLNEYEEAILTAISAVKSVKQTNTEFNAIIESISEEFGPLIAERARPYIEEIFLLGGLVGAIELGMAGLLTETNPRVAEFVRQHTLRLAGSVTSATVEAVRRQIAEGLQQGETGREIANRIRELDETTFSRQRAEMIARTESARAYTDGRETSWQESGVVDGKQWQVAAEACEFCEAVGREFNQKTVPLGDSFFTRGTTITGTSGGRMELDYEDVRGAPLHPHCRCSIQPVLRR